MPHRIVLVDDHQLFRAGLTVCLSGESKYSVVGEANDARSALEVVERTDPDVVVSDIGLPGESGISLTRELVRRKPRRKILVLTAHASEEFAAQAFDAGALGYGVKQESTDELLRGLALVSAGELYLTSMLTLAKVEAASKGGPLATLSLREREVFDLLVRGLSNRAVSEQLFISIKTVETHRTHVLRKLELHSLSEMIRFAARHGLLIVDADVAPAPVATNRT